MLYVTKHTKLFSTFVETIPSIQVYFFPNWIIWWIYVTIIGFFGASLLGVIGQLTKIKSMIYSFITVQLILFISLLGVSLLLLWSHLKLGGMDVFLMQADQPSQSAGRFCTEPRLATDGATDTTLKKQIRCSEQRTAERKN